MRVLVVYASHFGSTKEIAERIREVLTADGIETVMESADRIVAVRGFDAFVIGSAVQAGSWLKAASEFVRRHRTTLAVYPVWLFSSGPLGDQAARSPQPDPAEVDDLRREIGPRDHRLFAGAFDRKTADFTGFGLLTRTIVRRVLPVGDWRDWEAIESWAHGIARELNRAPAWARV